MQARTRAVQREVSLFPLEDEEGREEGRAKSSIQYLDSESDDLYILRRAFYDVIVTMLHSLLGCQGNA